MPGSNARGSAASQCVRRSVLSFQLTLRQPLTRLDRASAIRSYPVEPLATEPLPRLVLLLAERDASADAWVVGIKLQPESCCPRNSELAGDSCGDERLTVFGKEVQLASQCLFAAVNRVMDALDGSQ